MKLTAQLTALHEETRGLTRSERARRYCGLAKQLERAGEYDAACEALSELWAERAGPPRVDGLDEATKAEVLLRVGALAGWLGSSDQTDGNQEIAKNLITQSIELFQQLGLSARAAEARSDLALAYWREGSFDEARVNLVDALNCLAEGDNDLRALLLIRAGIIEERTQQLHEALRFYNEAAPFLDRSEDHALKGQFHNEYGLVFNRLAAPENREDYLDRALMEFTAASFHFELAGNTRFLARVENNLGYLFFTLGKYDEAHKHLDRARHFFMDLKDAGMIAQVDDTRARTLLAENRLVEAERVARYAVHTLDRGDERAVLAEALTTHGVALARLGSGRSRALLERAVQVAETTGDLEGAGRAKLSIIEELREKLSLTELISIYRSATQLLRHTQDPSTARRLISCAETLLDIVERLESASPAPPERDWEGFSLKQYLHASERAVIERALRDVGGSVAKAAHLLGFKHHQSLISLINGRHQDLKKARLAVRKRRRHLFSEPRRSRKKKQNAERKRSSEIVVLHVEDNQAVARLIRKSLGHEGIEVRSCISGATALKFLKTKRRYDALIVDKDLPGLSGLELVLHVRSMGHRRRLPIVMLAAANCEREAWRAGVDAFLRKPADVNKVSSTINRVLAERKEKKR